LQQAVPVTFGLVAAGWLTGLDEAADAVARVRAARLAVQFGGAAGALASLGADGAAVAGLLAPELGPALPVLPRHTPRSRGRPRPSAGHRRRRRRRRRGGGLVEGRPGCDSFRPVRGRRGT